MDLDRFFSHVNKTDSCWIWAGSKTNLGYGRIYDGSNGKRYVAHRLMWELTYGKIPDGMYICHTCDNKLCVNPDHLFLGTQKDNMEDCVNKGRFADKSNENNGRCKISNGDVIKMRSLFPSYTIGALSEMFGISYGHVQDIVHYRKRRLSC